MMKNSNLMTRVALTLLVMTLTATTAWADDSGSCGNNVTYKYSESTHTLTISGSGAMENYGTPTPPWYSYRNDIKAVVIDNGVTSIGHYAFQSCTNMTSVSIPNSVTSIGFYAFVSCSSLMSVSIPNSVTSINHNAFSYCSSLTSVSIPSSVTSINSCLFRQCSSLTSVFIPNSVTRIEERAFENCSSLMSVIINAETPPTLGSNIFYPDVSGKTVYVPSSSVATYKDNWSSYANNIVDVSSLFSQDGDTYTIQNNLGWEVFCYDLQDNATFNRFSGKTVKLGENITITRIAGSEGHEFCGIFDGNQKTLTVNINETSTQGTAPFREISGATIKNLSVAGSVTGTTHAAALVGFSRSGTNTIEDCNVSANVTVNTGNNKHCGGLVGHAVKSTLTIRNCIYSGTINNGGNYAGGLQGWSDGSTVTIENCLFSGSYTGSGLFHPIAVRYRNASMTSNINGAYYTAAPTLTDAEYIVTPGTQAYTSQQSFLCKKATILGTTIYYAADLTPFGKTDSYSPDGSAQRPFIISNTDGWDYFCDALLDNDTWNRFSGMTVKLGENITVSSMAGSEGHEFCGTFDGNRKTLTVSFNNSEGNAAPFREIRGATIKNLIVCGTIIGKKHSSGLVGYARGEDASVENTIENCLVNTDVSIANSETTGYLGGIVGHGLKSKLTIRGCAFTGSLTSPSNYTGGLQGWSDGNTLILQDDFFAPTRVSAANVGFHPVAIHGYGLTTIATVSNVYYTIAPTCTSAGRIAAQGKQVRSIVAGENVTINHIEPTGSSTNYTTSGITAYSGGGIMYDGKFYYGKDDVVSLTLSHEDQESSVFLGYEAKDSQQNAVTLTPAGDNSTLTMPDDDVTITAKVAMLYSLTLPDGMEVVSADPAAIGGKYKEGTTIQFKIKSEDYVLEGDVMNGDDVLTADADGSYIVKVGNADITITASFIVTLSGDMSYTAQDGDVLTGSTSGTVTIARGASITLSNVTINGGIVCLGTATIILVGENSVTGLNNKAGIQVGDKGTTLTIKGNGSLKANGGYLGAGIGTGYVFDGNVTLGDITIEGGSITAKGGGEGAGIGTGCVDRGRSVTLGDIIINGGSITAKGGDEGAGIGTGLVYRGSVTLGDITIKGGSITAIGGDCGAGIGTGEFYNGTATIGTLTIYDDIDCVDATGNDKSGISEEVVYMHGESNVTGNASDYFIITHKGYHDVIESIQNKKYSITLVNEEQHGTVTVPASAKCGESVTITVTPDNGYQLDTIEVKDANGNEVELDEDDMSFIMPDSNVTITVTFVKVSSLTLPDEMEVVSATPAAIDGKYKEGTIIQFKIKSEDYVVDGDVKNGDKVLTADANGIYTVTVGNADITITATVKKAVEPNVILSGGDYTAKDGDVLTGSTSGTVRIEHGASITLSDVTINGGIVCEGTATITLVGENSVTGLKNKAGIQVGGSGTALTIKGNGALTTTGGDLGAGIGTGSVRDETKTFGDIIIEGGSITANGGDWGAGIGTGYVNGATATLDNITIEGGSIMANGGLCGAGIGTGEVYGTATLGNITIKGGSITANGDYYGAGIGTGYVRNGGTATLSNIIIEGGNITANGDYYGAGIGTGYVNKGSATFGTLTIYDDIDLVDATGKSKSGIECSIVYKHGESNVTGNPSYYFNINDKGEHVVIESKKHTITLINDGKHGTVTVVAKEMSGESVTITVTPDNGYMLDTIEVKDANGNEVELDEDDMSFIMPDSNVTITVTWKYLGVKGDVNRDGTVDISDVVALVNIILNGSSDYQAEADVNNDGGIDISDVVALVNIILGQ